MLDCNVKLARCGSLMPSMALPFVLATEAYQLLFDPTGSDVFSKSLPALLERAGEVAAQRQQQSLEETLVKRAKGAKDQQPSAPRSAISRQGQRPNRPCK